MLSHLAAYQEVADIVRFHHERLDGSGYPNGIHGDAIPELSKVLAVADSYHAMTSDRPYRGARSSFEALKELRLMSGTTLDATLRRGARQGAAGQGPRLSRRQLHRLHGRVRARPHQPAAARPRARRRQRSLRVAAGRPSGRLTSARAVSAAATAFSTSSHTNGTTPVSTAAPVRQVELQREPGRAQHVDRHEASQARRSGVAADAARPLPAMRPDDERGSDEADEVPARRAEQGSQSRRTSGVDRRDQPEDEVGQHAEHARAAARAPCRRAARRRPGA